MTSSSDYDCQMGLAERQNAVFSDVLALFFWSWDRFMVSGLRVGDSRIGASQVKH